MKSFLFAGNGLRCRGDRSSESPSSGIKEPRGASNFKAVVACSRGIYARSDATGTAGAAFEAGGEGL
jgi:hypothetical protein